jgi:hypothetical protein
MKTARAILRYHFKEIKAMKYEAPELKVLVPAINAIQTSETHKNSGPLESILVLPDVVAAYEDWEE